MTVAGAGLSRAKEKVSFPGKENKLVPLSVGGELVRS